MKVILLQDIKGIGRKGDVKDVSDGHAKNLLIPKGMAKPATATAMNERGQRIASDQRQRETLETELRALAQNAGQTPLTFTTKTGKHGEVFGSVTKHDIETALLAKLPSLVRQKAHIKIMLDRPIKTLGEHSIEMHFGNTKATISVDFKSE